MDISESEVRKIVDFLIEHGITSIEKLKILFEPSYFATIPLSILEDNKLSPNAKLLYAEIIALTKKLGYCFATNNYLASRLGLSKRYISDLLGELQNFNLIKIEIEKGEKGTYRKIWVNAINSVGGDELQFMGRHELEFIRGMNYSSYGECTTVHTKRDSTYKIEEKQNNILSEMNSDKNEGKNLPFSDSKKEDKGVGNAFANDCKIKDSILSDNVKESIENTIVEKINKLEEKLEKKYKNKDAKSKKIYVNEVYKIAEIFSKEWENKFKDLDIPKWCGKEWKQAKQLIEKVGYENAELIVKYVFKNWNELSEVWKIRGNPSIGIILSYGVNILHEVKTGKKIGYKSVKKGRPEHYPEDYDDEVVAGWKI